MGSRDMLGVNQFYNANGHETPPEVVQTLAGLSPFHTIKMGINPRVIVAASNTSSNEIYWFNREELILFGLDTPTSSTEPWKLELYKSGLVLNTKHHESVRRSVSITFFCRNKDHYWRMLISEEDAHNVFDVSAFGTNMSI